MVNPHTLTSALLLPPSHRPSLHPQHTHPLSSLPDHHHHHHNTTPHPSHVNEAADPWAGLLGPIIITTPDNANEDGSPKDVAK